MRSNAFPPVMTRFWAWIVFLTLLSLAYTMVMTFIVKAKYPYAAPVIHYYEPFWDFTVFHQRFQHFHQPAFWGQYALPMTYPAALVVVFAFFYSLPHSLVIYLSLLYAVLVLSGWFFARQLAKRGVSLPRSLFFSCSVLLCCWPVWYLLNRANIEGFMAIVLGCGVLLVLRDRCWAGATLIGIAAAMKIFPFVLLALLLSKRRYKELAWGIAVAVLVNIACLAFVGPTVAAANEGISQGLVYFKDVWAANIMPFEIGFDHSLFAWVKLLIFLGMHLLASSHTAASQAHPILTAQHAIARGLKVYMAVTAVCGLLLYFVRLRKLPLLNQTIALTVCAVLLPPVSFDYTLTHLLVPFALLALYAADLWTRRTTVPGLNVLFTCFVIVWTPMAFITIGVRWAGQVRAVALLAIVIAVTRYRLPWGYLDGSSADEPLSLHVPSDVLNAVQR